MPKLVCVATALVKTIAFALGCTEAPVPATPSSPTPGPTASTFTVSGMVFDHTSTGRRALAALPLRIRIFSSDTYLNVTSDANGRFTVSGVPAGAVTIAPAADAGYIAPCPAGTDVLKRDATFDVHVVATALLSSAGAPESFPVTGLWVSGVVFETTSEGKQPVAGASVELAEAENGVVFSSTVTNALGHYLVCTAPPGVGTDQVAWIGVRKDRYLPSGRPVTPGFDWSANVELVRK
jgi:hypothetical protein